MSIDSEELAVNFACIEAGIVPVFNVGTEHVQATLSEMSSQERRIATRKFRRILKKAIRLHASKFCSPGTCEYEDRVKFISKKCALGWGSRGRAAQKITRSQTNFRTYLVTQYLSDMALF